MATLLLGAAGAAIGGAVGGSVLGLSSVILGRAIGATLGRVIDQRLMGAGSEVVEIGKLSRYRVTGASEGTPLGRVFARTRVGGHVIWSTRFKERVKKEDVGGKGGGGGATATTYSYSVSLAVALGEGPILRVGRVWADGMEIDAGKLDMRVYQGTEDQQPDPLIEAIEGLDNAPAYRGTAYVVIERMPLGDYGNRVPQLSFEVVRPPNVEVVPEGSESLSGLIEGVCLIPGSGEYALDTERAVIEEAPGNSTVVNLNTAGGETDFLTSLRQLEEEVPTCRNVVLVVCWFGTDLRCGSCEIHPRVEGTSNDATSTAWHVSGLTREFAGSVPQLDGRPVYGGTPTDQSVIAAISELRARGYHVTFYPFVLMEQMAGNGLPNPWTGGGGQPALPWRGRITTSLAPGLAGSPDGTVVAESEVQAFLGNALAGDFSSASFAGTEGTAPRAVVHNSNLEADWGYRRFILHCAHLCDAAGGVDAFCVGSELRSLTQIRGAGDTFPFVDALGTLVSEVRGILGSAKISYAADWSEYFGYHPQDGSGDVFFHLDALWAHPDVDFIGIDNYMPLTDWREGLDHLDAIGGVNSIYDIAYLKAGVTGGEGYDWYYPSQSDRDAQNRVPITDGAHGEDWIFRYKDLHGWWSNPHHERRGGGVRQAQPTGWQPESKPIWFTEFGCAAVDRATNQPNKFIDPKSSESQLPYYSDGARDEFLQGQYVRAVLGYWKEPANNPQSSIYGGRMVDVSKAHVWAWDTRPFPAFPTRADLWTDGENYARGHWLNGRTSHEALAAVIADICDRAGLSDVDVSRAYGLVRGYEADMSTGARGALQPLLLGYGVSAAERAGALAFSMRSGRADAEVDPATLARHREIGGDVEHARAPDAESPGRLRLGYIRALSQFETATTEAAYPGLEARSPANSELALVLSASEAQATAERWLAEGRVARDAVRFALPPSALDLGAGDVVSLGDHGLYRIDRIELGTEQLVEAVRVEPGAYVPSRSEDEDVIVTPPHPPAPVEPLFLDLPLLSDQAVEHAPYVAAAAEPWPGLVALYSAATDAGYALNRLIEAPAALGLTLDPMQEAAPSRWDRGPAVRVQLFTAGPWSSVERDALLSGSNAFAIGSGAQGPWEVFQAEHVELVAQDVYALSLRLRGQLGTDALIPSQWPVGSRVILLDGALSQIDLPMSARGMERHYRVGPASLAVDDPAFRHRVVAFDGVGLRPYRPSHLRTQERVDGGLDVVWIRRTRRDGDSWISEDVPLGEEKELYRVRVLGQGDAVLRSVDVTAPAWTWTSGDRVIDTGAEVIAVAQISQAFGAGPYQRIAING